jgi:GntR family transcriptional repressor for pyruvate dehydrogenase complex
MSDLLSPKGLTFMLPLVTDHATGNGPAYLQVAADLRDRIISGSLEPGHRLPIEAELAEEFGVSRSTIREALRVVSSQDLLVTQRGVNGGTFVKSPGAAHVTDMLEANLGLLAAGEAVTVDELLEVREILEVPAARLAARRATPERLRDLELCLVPDGDFDQHRQFHLVLVQAAGNRLLEVVTKPIFEVLRTRFLRDRADASFWGGVTHDHTDIVTAVRDGDADAAADAMRTHLRDLRDTYVEIDRERGR